MVSFLQIKSFHLKTFDDNCHIGREIAFPDLLIKLIKTISSLFINFFSLKNINHEIQISFYHILDSL